MKKIKFIVLLSIVTIGILLVFTIYLRNNNRALITESNLQIAFFDAELYMQTAEYESKMNIELKNIFGNNYKDVLMKNKMSVEKAQKIHDMFTIYKTGEKVYPDYYGGMYIGADEGLILQIVDSNRPTEKSSSFINYQTLINDKEYDKIEYVKNSYNELKSLKSIIMNRIESNKELTELFVSIGIDEKLNKIILELSDISSNIQSKLLADITRKDVIVLLQNEKICLANTYKSGQPIYIGQQFADGSVKTIDCTLGFRAKLGGKTGFVTAGHCFPRSTEGSSTNYGILRKKIYGNNTTIDAAFVEIASNDSVSNALNTSVNNVSLLSTSDTKITYLVGQIVSKLGAKTGGTTGRITNTSVNVSLNDDNLPYSYFIKDLVLTSIPGAQGDSGGPVFNPNGDVFGIVTAVDGNSHAVYFSKYNNIKSQFGITRY